ncbi:MAG: DinB family protein [Herpetosiphonaceae bacterium]|nr:DinB family protein [Herpetosiphonaceae bacterium]
MISNQLPLTTFYQGWDVYQRRLVTAITPLSAEQLALRTAPHMWSAGMLGTHIVATRVGWFHEWLGEGSDELAPLARWDEDGQPARSVAELVSGLESTWQMIEAALLHWTPADLSETFQSPYPPEEPGKAVHTHSRQWIIWHLLEHDLHHGGELSLILGMHGLTGLDL